MKTSLGARTPPAGALRGVLILVLAAFVGAGALVGLPGCGSDHTAGIVFDDDSDEGPAPTLTPPPASGALLGAPRMPTSTPLPR